MAPERPHRLVSLCALVFGREDVPNDRRGGGGPLWFELNRSGSKRKFEQSWMKFV